MSPNKRHSLSTKAMTSLHNRNRHLDVLSLTKLTVAISPSFLNVAHTTPVADVPFSTFRGVSKSGFVDCGARFDACGVQPQFVILLEGVPRNAAKSFDNECGVGRSGRLH
mmetsp:Transcript_14721/g.18556  ORF Transcript_14721/g.18556 Transcript_14721/m.18556 type:complete len:110 (-) Transcript_14721:296-625(-)